MKRVSELHRERQTIVDTKLISAARAAASVLADVGHKTTAGSLNETLFQIDRIDGELVDLIANASPDDRFALLASLMKPTR